MNYFGWEVLVLGIRVWKVDVLEYLIFFVLFWFGIYGV